MIPNAQKRWFITFFSSLDYILRNGLELGNPEVDLAVATVLMMVGGKLVLMRPRKVTASLKCYCPALFLTSQFYSLLLKRSNTICRSCTTGLSFVGSISEVSVLWRTPCGDMMGRASAYGSTL